MPGSSCSLKGRPGAVPGGPGLGYERSGLRAGVMGPETERKVHTHPSPVDAASLGSPWLWGWSWVPRSHGQAGWELRGGTRVCGKGRVGGRDGQAAVETDEGSGHPEGPVSETPPVSVPVTPLLQTEPQWLTQPSTDSGPLEVLRTC